MSSLYRTTSTPRFSPHNENRLDKPDKCLFNEDSRCEKRGVLGKVARVIVGSGEQPRTRIGDGNDASHGASPDEGPAIILSSLLILKHISNASRVETSTN